LRTSGKRKVAKVVDDTVLGDDGVPILNQGLIHGVDVSAEWAPLVSHATMPEVQIAREENRLTHNFFCFS
jgi:hypothetical protein